MQIMIRNDFTSNGMLTQAQIDSFLEDQKTAVDILNATFTNNISLTFDVGLGWYPGPLPPPRSQLIGPRDPSLGGVNGNTLVSLPYSQLRADLLTFGQPGFFNAVNLPAGDSINGMSDFNISSSAARALGLSVLNPGMPDGFVGMNPLLLATL